MIAAKVITIGMDEPREKKIPALLIGFGFLSLLAHAATFFVFQVTAPPRVTIPPQPTQVVVLRGDDPEQQALMRWIESEDPALIAASAHPVPQVLLQRPYVPSFMISRTPPRSMPVVPEAPVRPPGPELEALLGSMRPTMKSAPLPIPPAPTRLNLRGVLAREFEMVPLELPRVPATSPLVNAAALLGVAADGEVKYAFLQRSSGDAPVDKSLLRALQHWHLQPIKAATVPSIRWGFAEVVWGDGTYDPSNTPSGK